MFNDTLFRSLMLVEKSKKYYKTFFQCFFCVTHPRDIFLYASDRAIMLSKATVEI